MNKVTIYWKRPERVNGRIVPRKPVAIKDFDRGQTLDVIDVRFQTDKPQPPRNWLVAKCADGSEYWFLDPTITNEFADAAEADPFCDRSDCNGRD